MKMMFESSNVFSFIWVFQLFQEYFTQVEPIINKGSAKTGRNLVFLMQKMIFSSPEPKAPGELIGWIGSVIRRRRPSTISNDFSSETTGPIVTKFHI